MKKEHKGMIKGFGSHAGINFVVFKNNREVDIPDDIEVTISWEEKEKSQFKNK